MESFNTVIIVIFTYNVNYLLSIGWCHVTPELRKAGVFFLFRKFDPLRLDAYTSGKKVGYLLAPILKIQARERIQIHTTVQFCPHLRRRCVGSGNDSMNECPLINAATLVLFQECTSM